MTTQLGNAAELDSPHIPEKIKLAAAWASFMFLYIYVDHLVLYKPGVVEGILAGMVWEFQVSQAFIVAAFISVAIPSLMIVLSIALPARAVRTANLVVAALNIPYAIFNAMGETWVYFFGLSIGLEVLILIYILYCAWTWPRLAGPSKAAPYATAD